MAPNNVTPHREAPVRLCCGQRHYGVLCPDGMVMCCLCFTRVPAADVWQDGNGDRWDMCKPCGAQGRETRMTVDPTEAAEMMLRAYLIIDTAEAEGRISSEDASSARMSLPDPITLGQDDHGTD